MVQLSSLFVLAAASVSLVNAAPAASPVADPAPSPLERRATCTFTSAATAIQSKAACATIVLSNIAVPAGTTLDMTDLPSGTHLIFEGETSFGFEEWSGPLVSVSGTDITVTGASGNLLNGNGNLWWDGQGSNGGKTKPKFFFAHNMISSSITGLNFKNSPVQLISVDDSTDLTLTDIDMNNLDGNTGDSATEAANTDAFDIGSSSGITIVGATINNQDDCMAVNSGTDITFTGGHCSGSHGLSIGSVGGRDDNAVQTVLIENSVVEDSQNGIRIKTVSGATGSVKGVTFQSITLSGITDFGIVIEQDYENGDPTGVPTTGVPITGLIVNGVTGTVASGGVNYYILCGSSASCSGWTWEGVSVTGGTKTKSCENVPSVAQTSTCT